MKTKPFYKFDLDYDDLPEGTREAASFFQKLDWEGGYLGFLRWGGVSRFPEILQPEAQQFSDAFDALATKANAWAAENGVEY